MIKLVICDSLSTVLMHAYICLGKELQILLISFCDTWCKSSSNVSLDLLRYGAPESGCLYILYTFGWQKVYDFAGQGGITTAQWQSVVLRAL